MKVEVWPLDLKLRTPFTTARSSSLVAQNLVVRLENSDKTGLGEAAPSQRFGWDKQKVSSEIGRISREIDKATTGSNLLNLVTKVRVPPAKAALDIATHDLLAKSEDKPLYSFLGLQKPSGVTTSYTISLAPPKKMLEMAKLAEADGYKILKVKLGGPHDLEAMEKIYNECSARLRVDANEGWSPGEAVEKILRLEEFEVELVEQPVPADDLEGLKHVCQNTNIPIFADESVKSSLDVEKVAGFVDGVNVKLMKCGGIKEALKTIETAKNHGLDVMMGCMIESSISITAAAHLTSLVDYVDLDGNLLIVNDPYRGVIAEQGVLTLPEQPGLGVEPRTPGGPGDTKP